MIKNLDAAKTIEQVTGLNLVFQEGRAEAAAQLYRIELNTGVETVSGDEQGGEDDDEGDEERDGNVRSDGGVEGRVEEEREGQCRNHKMRRCKKRGSSLPRSMDMPGTRTRLGTGAQGTQSEPFPPQRRRKGTYKCQRPMANP